MKSKKILGKLSTEMINIEVKKLKNLIHRIVCGNRRAIAFTLSEVFVAMIVIAIVGSVCIAFLKNRNDYSREYMYYSTYLNLVKVMDTIMDGPYDKVENLNDTYPNPIWLTSCNGMKCMKLKGETNLCTLFREKLNHNFGDSGCVGKLANGIEFLGSADANLTSPKSVARIGNAVAYTLPIDIDGTGNGKDMNNYDKMIFYITQEGKVIPDWGASAGFRGYTANTYDAAANPSLMSFDVVYNNGNSNKLAILDDGRSVSFPVAACLAGYVSGAYCTSVNNGANVTKSDTCDASADCRVRLVKKLKWSR